MTKEDIILDIVKRIEKRIEKMEKRLDSLNNFRSYVLGVSGIVALIISIAVPLLMKYFGS